jgi:hypothetical protein
MIANVRRAERAIGRAERVRVLMEIGGPKVRAILPKSSAKPPVTLGDAVAAAEYYHRDKATHERGARLP